MNKLLEVLGLGGRILEAKIGLKEAKITAQAQAVAQSVDAEGAWERIAAENSKASWLDEWWTLVLTVPLIMAFVPWLANYVNTGFQALENVPEWYTWAVLASVSFAFARKTIPKLGWARRNR